MHHQAHIKEEFSSDFVDTREAFGEFTKVKIENTDTGVKLEIIPEKGAKINGLTINNGEKVIDIIDGYSTPEELAGNAYSKSSVLAPFPNRVADGQYSFEGEEYRLPINKPKENNSIHGFIGEKEFEVIESRQTTEGYLICLRYEADGSAEGYPFAFAIDLKYILTDTGLETEVAVENTSSNNMPFGHGWHPYFKSEGSVKDLELQLPAVEKIEVDERLIPNGERSPFSDFSEPKKIGEANFDTGFELMEGSGRVVLIDRENNLKISLVMESENNKYKYVQIFTPPEGSPAENSIAIEPMTCEANAFNSGNGLLVLAPGEKFNGSYKVEVSSLD